MKDFLVPVILVGLLVWYLFAQVDQYNKFNTWSDNCVKAGGFVFQSHKGFITEEYTCHLPK